MTVDFQCPFCTGHATVFDGGLAGVAHSLPACPMFLELYPTEFLHAVNTRLQADRQ